MTDLSAIREKILTDDAFVLSETRRLQYLYGLKHEIRYNQIRQDECETESVAEHVYGMHVLASYFLPLETSVHPELESDGVQSMITWHDIDEIETGDTIGYLKTEAMRAAEGRAAKTVIANMPQHMQDTVTTLLEEYEALESISAQFVKAIDRIEPLFQIYTPHGKNILQKNRTTREQSDGLKYPYVQQFETMLRFVEVTGNAMQAEGYYFQ
jgi:5'-deoxynucleotidase YfbR-like HD superfamily hydrolase